MHDCMILCISVCVCDCVNFSQYLFTSLLLIVVVVYLSFNPRSINH